MGGRIGVIHLASTVDIVSARVPCGSYHPHANPASVCDTFQDSYMVDKETELKGAAVFFKGVTSTT